EHEHEHEEAHDAHLGHQHDHHGTDPHIWLDPDNAIAMLDAIEHTLSDKDPENAPTYHANAEKTKEKLAALSAKIEATLKPARGIPFVVFHDAYNYFEHRFGVGAIGSVKLNPEAPSSAEHISEIHHKMKEENVACVFSEPQFPAKIVSVVSEGTNAKTGVLDPIGSELANGPDLYPELLTAISSSMSECLLDK
ncbi:MAG: zinc ABC transporter substrate-binding protein, partial [Rhodobacteraceae bacterium]|nr:zinc ABC transporter substrate-binding protein [Paracoccaceae bacterium]